MTLTTASVSRRTASLSSDMAFLVLVREPGPPLAAVAFSSNASNIRVLISVCIYSVTDLINVRACSIVVDTESSNASATSRAT